MRGFRLLVVEDQEEVLQQLIKLLLEALRGSIVDGAATVDDALARIDAALLAGVSYDLAILDFKLPQRLGEVEDVNESVCARLAEAMPAAIISHITAYAEDASILKHLARVHTAGRPQGFFLNKLSTGFHDALVGKTREALYGSSIEREISDMFPSSDHYPRPDGEGARSAWQRRSTSISNRIADLCLDIGTAWTHLGTATRTEVRKFFLVDESKDPVSVVLR